MKNYVVVYSAEDRIHMNEVELGRFLDQLKKGVDNVEFKGDLLTRFYRLIRKVEPTEGRLHDGSRVKRVYGRWVDMDNPDVRLDPRHYPEIEKDEIMSEDEYQEKLLAKEKQIGAKIDQAALPQKSKK